MEIVHTEDFEGQKRRLFETAEWTLQRLNRTISDMKIWNRERETLTSDIYRLKIALGYSEKLLGDPLVMHQSEEIHRLERLNSDMRTKVESMSVALMNAERSVSWNVERKVRSEMASVKCQVAEEKLHLAREIARLRSRLNEAECDSSVYHEIRQKLDGYVDGDRQLDTIIAEAARKLIDTVHELTSQLIKVGTVSSNENTKGSHPCLIINKIDHNAKEISNEVARLQLERQVLLKETEEKIHKINVEKESKVRALKRVASSLRTKLIISLGKNEKLCAQLSDLEGSKNTKDASDSGGAMRNEKFSRSDDYTQVNLMESNEKLIKDNCDDSYKENDRLMEQLEMERTTTREALKEFERSLKETGELCKNVQHLQMMLSSTREALKKLKIENKDLRKSLLTNDVIKVDRRSIKIRQFILFKVKLLRMKVEGQTIGVRKLNSKIDSDPFFWRETIASTGKLIEELSEENRSSSELAEAEIKAATSMTIADTNGPPKTSLKIPADLHVSYEVKHMSKADQGVSIVLLDSSASQGEFTSARNFSIDSARSEGIDGASKHASIIEGNERGQMAESAGFDGENEGKSRGDDIAVRGHWTIKNDFPDGASPEVVMRNLEELDRELSSMKSELSSVRGEINSLRVDLHSRRLKNRLLEGENVALKGELAEARARILRTEEENRNLKRLEKIRGKS